MDITPTKIQNVLTPYLQWVWLLLLPLLVLGSFVYRIIQALFYSIIGLIFSLIAKVQLSFVEIYKITIIAITPAIAVGTLIDLIIFRFRYEWIICFGIAMLYLIFGIGANNQAKE